MHNRLSRTASIDDSGCAARVGTMPTRLPRFTWRLLGWASLRGAMSDPTQGHAAAACMYLASHPTLRRPDATQAAHRLASAGQVASATAAAGGSAVHGHIVFLLCLGEETYVSGQRTLEAAMDHPDAIATSGQFSDPSKPTARASGRQCPQLSHDSRQPWLARATAVAVLLSGLNASVQVMKVAVERHAKPLEQRPSPSRGKLSTIAETRARAVGHATGHPDPASQCKASPGRRLPPPLPSLT